MTKKETPKITLGNTAPKAEVVDEVAKQKKDAAQEEQEEQGEQKSALPAEGEAVTCMAGRYTLYCSESGIRFTAGKEVTVQPEQMTGWIKCQLEAGVLKRV